jgi:hypothetical protein
MNKMMNKFLQPRTTFRNLALWENLYGDSHPPSSSNHFVPLKYSAFHQKQNWRIMKLRSMKNGRWYKYLSY